MSTPYTFTSRVLSYYLCVVVIIICALLLNLWGFDTVRTIEMAVSVSEWHEQDFSYLEDDHPPTFLPPSQHLRNAALIMEETVHYSSNTSEDWESMLPAGSQGFVRLGPHMKLFGVSMYHQLHCLQMLQQSTTPTWDSERFSVEHLQHCLNYLRESFLCAANLRLEPLRNDGSDIPKTNGIGLEHRCRDWTLVKREVEANFEHWDWEDERL